VNVVSRLRAEGATRNDWFLDASMAVMGVVLLQVPFLVGLVLLARTTDLRTVIIAAVTGTIMFLAGALRRHYPGVFFAVTLVFLALQAMLLTFPTISWLILFIAVFDVARWMPPWHSRVALVLALIAAVTGPTRWVMVGDWVHSEVYTVLILGVVSCVGGLTTAYSIGRRGYDVGEARLQQVSAEYSAAQALLEGQAVRQRHLEAKVRTEISRELHDIVAHSVAVMVVQAEGGLAQVDHSPQLTRQALSTIAETGREALQEMRHIVRILRSDVEVDGGDTIEWRSAPTVSDFPALVEKSGATLMVTGEPHGLTPSIEVTLYRVVQEALTNSLKHAGPQADPRVTLAWGQGQVEVTIVNRATEWRDAPDNHGAGLLGMSERVQALDGTLFVGPDKQGGFTVCARIPL
jgi:signal transduction histidine kinase